MGAFEELKSRLYHLAFGFAVGVVSCYLSCCELFVIALSPLEYLCFLDIGDAFAVTIKTVVVFDLLCFIPLLGVHVWGFVSPGLTKAERGRLGLVLSGVYAWLLCCLFLCHALATLLFNWFLGFSWTTGSLVVQYMPIIAGFLWFKLKCFLSLAVSLPVFFALLDDKSVAWLSAQGRAGAPTNAGHSRRSVYSVAVLFGAMFAVGPTQIVVSLCVICVIEFCRWYFFAKAYWSRALGRAPA